MHDDQRSYQTHMGFLAQDVEEALYEAGINDPAMLVEDEIPEQGEGRVTRYGLRYDQLLAPMVGAIQDLQEQVRELKSL